MSHAPRWRLIPFRAPPFSFPHTSLLLSVVFALHSASPHAARAFEPGDDRANASTDDDEEQGSDLLREIRRASAPILAAMAAEHGYGLAAGEDLRRVPPPFAAIRAKYYRVGHPGQADAIRMPPSAMGFRWSDSDSRLESWGMSFGGFSLRSLLDMVAGVKDQVIEGPDNMLRQEISGDWVFRAGTRDFQIIKQLERVSS